ncbi:MAG: DUF4954 family protein, partial [Bacteroidia bacterium]|nr:DUF4954 family protein [Bacteroidia bacterium]
FYNCIAIRFILGSNSNLKYGARLLNSFLGDNSTISCCEVLNNLIFPAHEQHHNNSFLVAAVVMGQSNMAAGATMGSNHNSRSNDNEIQAGRGFWPGLCTSVKHSCRFASYTLLSKSDYPAEMDIQLPFSLLNNNVSLDQLEVMPAFWWMYNMYALARNSAKYVQRDIRLHKVQKIEFDAYAPDTVEEIIRGRRLLEIWTAKASLRKQGLPFEGNSADELAKIGLELLKEHPEEAKNLEILGDMMEKSKRKVVILKAYSAWNAYGDMLYHYALKNLIDYMEAHPKATLNDMHADLKGKRQLEWVNMGGQLMLKKDVDKLRTDICSGKLNTWKEIHARYDKLWDDYPRDKQKHAYAILCEILNTDKLSLEMWLNALSKEESIQQFITDQVYVSREKDYENTFRQITFKDKEEMNSAIGTIDDNSFVVQTRQELEDFRKRLSALRKRA